jgi:sugar phosphate isomerase/epimerase
MKKVIIAAIFSFVALSTYAQKKTPIPEIGVVQNLENDSLIRAYGYRYTVESVAKLISPKAVTEEQFEENLKKIKKLRKPLYACNIFIPGELKVVGPDVNESAVLSYAEKVFQRCKLAGVTMIIWGSGGSRRLPDGFDREKAKEQFVSVAQKIADLGRRYNMTFALENLNSTETNFITRAEEAFEIVKRVDRKNFGLCVDIYHMLKEGESPSSIEKAASKLIYCEVAEKENRTPPGVHAEDFRPYLSALKKVGYKGKIVIECRWDDFAKQGKDAYQYLSNQLNEVYNQ